MGKSNKLLRDCLNFVFGMFYRVFFLSNEGILRLIAIAMDRKIAEVWRKKAHKRTKG